VTGGVLRCEARMGQGICRGPCGVIPVPEHGFVYFVSTAKRLPNEEDRTGTIWVCCRTCGLWNEFRILVVLPLADTG
jgi:hypothetical protein